jgi:hypothetical protein
MAAEATRARAGLTIVLTLSAIVLGVLGGGLFAAPGRMAHLYGAAVSADGTNAGRTAGAAIFALAVLAWLSRAHVHDAGSAVGVPVLFVWFALKSLVAYVAVVEGAFNPIIGNMILLFDVLMAIVYGYFLVLIEFKKKPQS